MKGISKTTNAGEKFPRSIFLVALMTAITFFGGCTDMRTRPTGPVGGSFEMIFTDPYGYDETLDRALELIGDAQKCIFLACYGMDLTDISQALIDAHNRGVVVEVVCDDESFRSDPSHCFEDMTDAGIEVIPDASSDIISHDKYMVIDSAIVWTGSTNFTFNGFFLNNNNVIIVNSEEVARAYAQDFQQMFEGYFHTNKSSNGVEEVEVADGYVEVWFGPQDEPANMLVNAINDAQESIEFCIYAFTLDEVAQALIEAHRRGVVIRGIFDEGTISDSPTQYYTLQAHGLDVRTDPCPYAFHHKFMVIDRDGNDPIVITGSGNWSFSGTARNDENFLVVHSSSVAQEYYSEFMRWWQETESFAAAQF